MKARKGKISEAEEIEIFDLKEVSRRVEILERYLSKKITRKSAQGLIPCSNSTFYRLLNKYDEEIGSTALLSSARGRKQGETQLDEKIEKIILLSIQTKLRGRKANYSKIWEDVKERCLELGLRHPSHGTVTARIKNLSPLEIRKLKYGAADAYDKLGMKPGQLKLVRPLEVTQIDHTLVDIILCDDDRKPLGRPWLTMLIDVKTRVVLSYYLAWHHPSQVSVAATIAFAVADKSDYLSIIGCENIRYPFSGKPEAIHSDNAKEFRSASMESACAKNRITLKWRPPGKKHYGGHIERLIGTFMGAVHFLPGTTFSNTKERNGYNSEKESCLTFYEFSKWLATQVGIYHSSVHSSLKMTPGDAWVDYFEGRDPCSLTGKQKAELTIDFLPQKRRAVSTKGIRLNNEYYYGQELTPHSGKEVLVKYNPLSMRRIWVYLNGEYISISLSDITRGDHIYEASRIQGLDQEEKSKVRWVTEEDRTGLIKSSESLVDAAKKATKADRKRRAIIKEHGARVLPPPTTEIKVDYSKKPQPFRSES